MFSLEIAEYLTLPAIIPGIILAVVFGLGMVGIFYGKRILTWVKGKLASDTTELQYDDIELLIEDGRQVSDIPAIGKSIEQMTENKTFNAVYFMNYMIAQCHNLQASDLHLTPKGKSMTASMRIEGTLYDVVDLPGEVVDHVLRRIKIMSSLDVYALEQPQDGRIQVKIKGEDIDIRVSMLPTIHGEKSVLRFFITPLHLMALQNLGINRKTLEAYNEIYTKPQGTIFMTGPTGSGKTITAYATLNAIKKQKGGKVNIVSIENPVEFDLEFANQTQVNDKVGLTFAVGLRSLLRQDPDVILIGEIRDRETAEIAMQAGNTGHLILSSVHTDSTAGAFTRVINMGIEPFVLASASSAVMSQRLVRKLCPHCRERTEITQGQLKKLAKLGIVLADNDRTFMTSKGCEKCLGMGIIGRTGIYELLVVDDNVIDDIVEKRPAQTIYAGCINRGMISILHEGLERARQGVVSIDELLTVL